MCSAMVSSTHEILLAQFLTSPDKLAYLVGAGISCGSPSGLPTANAFIERFSQDLCKDVPEISEKLADVLAQQRQGQLCTRLIRFETIMAQLQFVDHEFRIMETFTKSVQPNGYHKYLARQLANGATVMTTNFDNLIEIACRQEGIDYQLIVTAEEFAHFVASPESFPRPLLKLHGGYDAIRSDGQILLGAHNLHATIHQVGQSHPEFKRTKLGETLSLIFEKKKVVVFGYSGSDDFDIMPALYSMTTPLRVLWVNFDPNGCEPITIPGPVSNESIAKIEEAGAEQGIRTLIDKRKGDEVSVVIGDTAQLLGLAAHQPDTPVYSWVAYYDQWYKAMVAPKPNARVVTACILNASGHHKDCLSLLKNVDLRSFGREHLNLSVLYADALYASGKYEDAIDSLSEFIALPPKSEHRHERAYAFYILSRMHTDRGQDREANIFLAAALQLEDQDEPSPFLHGLLHEVGRKKIESEKLADAIDGIELLEASARLSRQIGDLVGLGGSLTELARAKFRIGRINDARTDYDSAIKFFNLTGYSIGLNVAYHGLALMEESLGDKSSARLLYQKAIEAGMRAGSHLHLAHSLNNLGRLYIQDGAPEEAKAHLLESLRIKEDLRDQAGINVTKKNLDDVELLEVLLKLKSETHP